MRGAGAAVRASPRCGRWSSPRISAASAWPRGSSRELRDRAHGRRLRDAVRVHARRAVLRPPELLDRAAPVAAGEDRHRLRRLPAVPHVRAVRDGPAARATSRGTRRRPPARRVAVALIGATSRDSRRSKAASPRRAGFRAAGVACGIKRRPAGARPRRWTSRSIVADEPVVGRGRVHDQQGRRRAGRRVARAPVAIRRPRAARSSSTAAARTRAPARPACAVARDMAAAAAAARRLRARSGARRVDRRHRRAARHRQGPRGRHAAAARARASTGSDAATRAIMTTDPFPKSCAVAVDTPDGTITVGGMAKGSGMIEPRMATMLGVPDDGRAGRARRARRARCGASSTRRSTRSPSTASARPTTACSLLASGASGVVDHARRRPGAARGACARSPAIWRARSCAAARARPSSSPCTSPARRRTADAWLAARTIANSPLVKTAIHGGDPNWGRLVAAAGRSGAAFDLDRASVAIGAVPLFVERRAARRARRRGRRSARRRRTSRSRSTSAPADRTTPRCGRAISARSTCASTRSTGHESSGTAEIQGRDPDAADRAEPPVARRRRTFCRCSIFVTTSSSACSHLAAEMKQDRAERAPVGRSAAGRPARRAAVREAVAAHAHRRSSIAVRELGGEVIEPPADVAFGGRETRRGRRAQPRALGRRRRRPHVRAGAARAVRRRRAAAARRQRADRRGTSVSGAGRHADAAEQLGDRSRAARSRSSATATTSRRRSRTPARCSACTCASRRRRATSCRRPSSRARASASRVTARRVDA